MFETIKVTGTEYGNSLEVIVKEWTIDVIQEMINKVLLVDARRVLGLGQTIEIRITPLNNRTQFIAWYTNDIIRKSQPTKITEPITGVHKSFRYCGRISTSYKSPLSAATKRCLLMGERQIKECKEST